MLLRFLIWISRYLLAITFIFSGFVKGVDPFGLAYKFGDYFMAFGFDFLMPFALPLSFVLCAAELVIGLLLLFNIRMHLASWGAMLFMAVFTPLTLVLAIYNPVSDCGCFGDAIILTNWETFFKNVPLLAASIFLVYQRKGLKQLLPFPYELAIALLLLVLSFMPSIHGYRNLPLIDFRPYSIGANIPEGMQFPEDAPTDVYKTILYYERDGEVKEFTQGNFPWQDTTWVFVDSKSILVEKGYEPPINNFMLTDLYGWDLTDSVLHSPGYTMLAVAYRLNDANTQAFSRLNELYFKAKEERINFFCLTASTADDIDRFISTTGVAFPFLQADEIMLKTTVRANPGLILLHEGTIVGKWHYRNLPEPAFFEGNLTSKALVQQQAKTDTLWTYLLIFTILLTKLILFKVERRN